MWVLLISLYLNQPLGQTQSKGVIHAPQTSYDTCVKERDRIRQAWTMDGYRVSPRCIYVPYYSTNNGAYQQTK